MRKYFIINLVVVLLGSISEGFSSSQELLEDDLRDDEHCLTIARRAIQQDTIASYEPFDWLSGDYGFDFSNEASLARAQKLQDALQAYFQREITDLFQKKLAMNRTMPDYTQVEDHYKLLVNYKDSIVDLFQAASSIPYCGAEVYDDALKIWNSRN